MNVLVRDVLRTILLTYITSPQRRLCALACRPWSTHLRDVCEREFGIRSIVSLKQLAREGRSDLLQWIRKMRAPRDWSNDTKQKLIFAAARWGHTPLVRMGKDDWKAQHLVEVILYAAKGGHEDIVRLCVEEWEDRPLPLDWAMSNAAHCGHEGVVRLCHDVFGARDVDRAMASAAEGGHESIVRVCYEQWNAVDVNRALHRAAQGGHEHIMRLCHDQWGARDVNLAMIVAACWGHAHIVQICYDEWGASATDVQDTLKSADANGFQEIVNMCRQWLATTARDRVSHRDAYMWWEGDYE